MELLTHSRLSCYRACPKRHFFRYELGLTLDTEPVAMRVGSAFHVALEAIDNGLDPEAEVARRVVLDPWEMGMVAAMFTVHRERWEGDTLEVVATELAFDLPLLNPNSGKASSAWRLAGKIDRVFRLPDGRLAIKDRKTTTESIASDSDLWTRLNLDQQMSIYLLAARELGYDVQVILYDVTVRPMLRPFKKTPPDKIQIKKNGEPYANVRLHDETPFDFTVRVAEAMRAEPDRYFARHEIARLDDDLDELRHELWQQSLAIRSAQDAGHWWRNPGACVTPFHCPYLSICGSRIDHDYVPSGFRKLSDVHPELSMPPSGGQPAHATQRG